MPIKFEIVAANAAEFFQQLEDLLRGPGPQIPMPSMFEAIEEPHTIVAPPESVQAAVAANLAQMQKDINEAPAKPKRIRNRSKVKPLPADDDPLATTDEPEEEPEAEEEDTEEFDPPPVDTQLIEAATSKLRDLFKINAKGVAGVRALREKYQVKYFHEVPIEKAPELWADAIKLEAELGV